ncbi:hypothetical protein [Morganella morganii]|uniref:hypothetical protein n=1 Tax=Morganella morganii TaxID=582 RepID=UPI0021A931F7|nr:hypothetical protein [Morganella morganii]MDN3813655.1 hypothetical protein [Morganella morganii]HCT5877726.1 hypothetical protein [Morganella morganii]
MSQERSTKALPLVLDIDVKQDGVINGIEMGVLGNGIPYLTQSSLAKVCGVQRLRIKEITDEWAESVAHNIFKKGKMTYIGSYLIKEGFNEDRLYIPIMKNGVENHAYPDIVCMAILEYYAFESKAADNEIAIKSYRDLTKKGLRNYIYESLNYTPDDPWKFYHDRVSLLKSKNTVPDGYFIVFNEISGMMVDLITSGLVINQHTVPDGSVGNHWGRHWNNSELGKQYGHRCECEHYYPEEFAQSKSNPQIINAYPNEALPEFRRWFKHEYLQTKFPKYILTKANLLPKGKQDAQLLIDALKLKEISN